MFGSAVKGTPVMDAPKVEEMVRARGKLPQAEALGYAAQLDNKSAATGCYVVQLERPCRCPVGCFYNFSEGDCLWPGCGTIPFGCCVILNKTITDGTHYINAKGDTLIVKVDVENDTLACYVNDCGTGPCCYCIKN